MKRIYLMSAAVSLAMVAGVVLPAGQSLAQMAQAGKAELGSYGFDAAGMDAAVKPGDDFYRYANGAWLASTKIPDDKSNYGMFTRLGDLSDERVKAILLELSAKPGAAGTISQKIGDYYASYMDEAAIEKAGTAPLKPLLAKIAAVQNKADVARMAGELLAGGANTPLFFYIGQDDKNPEAYIATFFQRGLGLPDRDFYREAQFEAIRARYKQHIQTMLTLAGVPDAAAKAAAIYSLEEKIAEVHWRKEDNRDPDKTYNKWTRADFDAKAPGVDWSAFFKAAHVSGQSSFLVNQPSALTGVAALLAGTPLETIKAYYTFHAISGAADVLPKAFVEESFQMYGKTLSGTPQLKERWKRGVDSTSAALGEAIGQVYVQRHFPPAAKARMDKLVANVVAAYRERISALDWMSPDTKKRALEKLGQFTPKIGYPTKWRDYGKLSIKRGDAFGNAERATTFEFQRNIDKLGKPLDRTEWGMTPQTVNAYYNPPMNEIVFPAAILQPPFFDPNADDAVNYGGIGAVIGHEIGHGFDDQGSKYDGTGKLQSWWTEADRKAFEARGDALVAQYDVYEPVKGHKVNGRFTLGENIGDLGGLQAAYTAYRMSLGGKEAPVIDGMTGDQRYFLGWAQVWRRLYRDQNLIQRIVTDPHSPSEFRTNGVVRNLDAWYAAFNVQPGDKLYLPPEQRVKIW